MGDVREYDWAFSLVGGAIALIAFLTPAGYISNYASSMYVWMWGLFSLQVYGYGTITRFTQDPGEIFVSLIGSLIVLISIGIIIYKGNNTRKFKRATAYNDSRSWAGASVMLMIGTIVWIVGLEINTQMFYDLSMWANLNPGFGVIGMFLGGILSLIGYGVSKMSPVQPKEVIVPMKKQFMSPEQAHTEPSPVATDLAQSSFKFCPMCGYKMMKTDPRYCVNCGEQFESVAPETKQDIQIESKSSAIELEPEKILITIPPETEQEPSVKEDCPKCALSRKLKHEECVWCGKIL